VGAEALLRWRIDGDRVVPPNRFIPILEKTGLIYEVGLWVLSETLKQHKRLIEKGFPPLRFSINLSLVQFQSDELVKDFSRIIKESKVDPKYIEMEITENLFFEDPEVLLHKVNKLKDLGVSIAIDDFGKGYSSLNRLQMIPFGRLKIDKDIIDHIAPEKGTTSLTKIIVLLAKTFKARVIAEGVETREQADFLKTIDCDEIQGFHFSKPLVPELLEKFLKKTGVEFA